MVAQVMRRKQTQASKEGGLGGGRRCLPGAPGSELLTWAPVAAGAGTHLTDSSYIPSGSSLCFASSHWTGGRLRPTVTNQAGAGAEPRLGTQSGSPPAQGSPAGTLCSQGPEEEAQARPPSSPPLGWRGQSWQGRQQTGDTGGEWGCTRPQHPCCQMSLQSHGTRGSPAQDQFENLARLSHTAQALLPLPGTISLLPRGPAPHPQSTPHAAPGDCLRM